jgi:hypothetical protein
MQEAASSPLRSRGPPGRSLSSCWPCRHRWLPLVASPPARISFRAPPALVMCCLRAWAGLAWGAPLPMKTKMMLRKRSWLLKHRLLPPRPLAPAGRASGVRPRCPEVGGRCCRSAARAVQHRRHRFWFPVPFRHGSMVVVADVSLLVTAQLIAGIPLGALTALRMVTGRVGVAMLAACSASCQALWHQSCQICLQAACASSSKSRPE